MRAMKDSGIAWIGEIPEDWEIKKLKYTFFHSNAGEVIDKSYWNCGSELLYTCQKEPINSNYSGFPEAKRTGINDLLLTRNATPYVFIPETHSIYSNVVQRISLRQEYDRRYIRYSLLSAIDSLVALGDTIPSYNMEIWENITLPIMQQQHRIADYLDHKCSQIDAIIARQQEVIEKLKAYKLSVITEAVTKGLNPHAPMKDSGVEWIGEIPEQWRMIRLKFLMSDIIDCPHETPAYSDDGEYLVIRTADQDLGKLRADQDMYRLNKNEYQNRIRRMALNKNDIVYGREGERWGLACLVPESNKYCLGQRMLQFRCKNELLLPHFAVWALNSKYIYLQGSVDTIGSTSPHVNISTVQNFLMPVPQICEQQEITEYIDKKMLQLDKDLLHRNTLIRKLIEYKKSLVYEVVTGKKEVI